MLRRLRANKKLDWWESATCDSEYRWRAHSYMGIGLGMAEGVGEFCVETSRRSSE